MKEFLFAILSVYRIARLLYAEDGPYDLIYDLRSNFDRQRVEIISTTSVEEETLKDKTIVTISNALSCPYCLGMWASIFVYILYKLKLNFVVYILALAGAQSIIERIFAHYEEE